MKLNDIAKKYNGIDYIFIEEAEELVNIFSKKNRKVNNQIEYQLSDDKKSLYSITRDSKNWCGDFLINVTTPEVLEKAKLDNN